MAARHQLTGAARALHALLAPAATDPPAVLVGKSVNPRDLDVPCAVQTSERQIPAALRSAEPPVVVVVASVSATLFRVVRSHPPALLIVTGPELPRDTREALAKLPSLHLLGPGATLVRGDGKVVALAASRAELRGLQRVLPHAGGVLLALAPTPTWVVEWLTDPTFQTAPVAGYVMARDLDLRWAIWGRTARRNQIVVPLGTTAWTGDETDPDLTTKTAAQALERLTGPVFPAPRVLARLLAPLGADAPEPTPDQVALWDQARRALPSLGGVAGMKQPRPGLSLEVPTAAFLAQRVLLHLDQRESFERASVPKLEPPDESAGERARQVLASSGQILSDHESKVVLRGVGMAVTRQAVASSATGAAHYAETIGFPVVLKALSPDLRRKQEIGGVILDLRTAAAVRRAYADIARNMEEKAPTARLDGVLVSEMMGPGLDIHCGVTRLVTGEAVIHARARVGPAVREPALALVPLRPTDAVLLAHAVLTRIPYPALRRASDPDVQVLADLFRRLDQLLQLTGERILSVDLNPARWVHDTRGYVVLDATITQRAHLDGL